MANSHPSTKEDYFVSISDHLERAYEIIYGSKKRERILYECPPNTQEGVSERIDVLQSQGVITNTDRKDLRRKVEKLQITIKKLEKRPED